MHSCIPSGRGVFQETMRLNMIETERGREREMTLTRERAHLASVNQSLTREMETLRRLVAEAGGG